jgi:aminoglycoside phosphotransferase (APT) family kinase protein
MTQLLLPAVPYDATARRPSWDELPFALHAALETRLGASVERAKVSGCGFTPGFAAVLTTVDGAQHFVKAAHLSTQVAHWYGREAKVTAALPSGIPTAALRWSDELADHVVLCFDAVTGARTPSLPWSLPELRACLDALTATARALTAPTPKLLALQPEPFGAVLDHTLGQWRSGQAGPDPHLDTLVALETRFDELTRTSTTLIHCDLRLDNLLFDTDGKAWICDWNFLGYGPPWLDLLTVLLSAEASGLDVDTLFATHPLAAGLPGDALDAGLAAILGYYRYSGALPEIENAPAVRSHQRYYAELTSRWLARRQRWA